MIKRLLFLLLFSTLLFSQDNSTLTLNKFLAVGPIGLNTPVSIDDESEFDYKELLKFEIVDIENLWPAENDLLRYSGGEFNFVISDGENLSKSEKDISVCYLAAYVSVDRFTELKFEAKSDQMLSLYVDNKFIGQKKKYNKYIGSKPGKFSKKIQLETGKHLFLIKTIEFKNSELDWTVNASLIKIPSGHNVKITLDPVKFTDVSNLLDDPKIGQVSISADGKIAGVTVTKRSRDKKSNESWLEFYDTGSGKLLRSLRGLSKITSIDWAPAGRQFSYTTRSNKKTTLWLSDYDAGTNEPVLSDIENFGDYEWSNDATFIIYSVSKELKKIDPDLKKYDNLDDRYPWGNDVSTLYILNVNDRTTSRLTFGNNSTSLNSISPDGKSIIFSVTKRNMQERPFSRNKLYLLDLLTNEVKLIHESKFGLSASWSPSGENLLIQGSPTTFGNIGLDIPENIIPNDYEGEAYIYNFKSGDVKAITKKFDPAISQVNWLKENIIYFTTIDKTFLNLYKYSIDTNKFELVNLGVEAVESIDFSTDGSTAVYRGSSANIHPKAFFVDLQSNSAKLLLDADEDNYSKIKLGEVKEFIFITEDGKPVQGRISYPPNFVPAKKYPVIVHYYAGTSPMTRRFEGRYPENIWAANGYLVYTITPSGTYGFGQEHAAKHVNDWGKITAEEIISATQELIKNNSFVDAEKVGCIGASYGGFETMNIITKTDIYSAAISHAGISALSSYWGEGYWGFSYSAVASAESYPWNNKKLFVEHSPLFNADKINTPLLLLHGDADTNVPVGESYQMYAALKILNRDVEMVTIKDLDHHIMQYDKRKKWTKTILAYFDWKLKGQPEWWNNLYD